MSCLGNVWLAGFAMRFGIRQQQLIVILFAYHILLIMLKKVDHGFERLRGRVRPRLPAHTSKHDFVKRNSGSLRSTVVGPNSAAKYSRSIRNFHADSFPASGIENCKGLYPINSRPCLLDLNLPD